jgi:hypothetical protein
MEVTTGAKSKNDESVHARPGGRQGDIGRRGFVGGVVSLPFVAPLARADQLLRETVVVRDGWILAKGD